MTDLKVIPGEGNPDDDIDFAWRPFKVIASASGDGAQAVAPDSSGRVAPGAGETQA